MLRDRGIEVLCGAVIHHESLENLNISFNNKNIISLLAKELDFYLSV